MSFDGGSSKLKALKGKAIARAYGDEYRAFMERLGAMNEAADPVVAAVMRKLREGEQPRAGSRNLHHRVLDALREVADADLRRLAEKFPGLLPDGAGSKPPKQLFAGVDVRETLAGAKSEEMRAVALWLGERRPAIAFPLEALDAAETSEPMRCAALRTLGHASHEQLDDAFHRVAKVFLAPASIHDLGAAQGAIRASRPSDLAPRLCALLPKMANAKMTSFGVDPALFLLKAIERRALGDAVAIALARFAKAERRQHLAKMAEEMARATRCREAIAILATSSAKAARPSR